MIIQIIDLDKKITFFLQNLFPHNRFFDLFFSFFSLQGVSVFIWIIIFILTIIFEERKNPGISTRDKKFILTFTLSLLITGLLVNVILKNVIHRARPQLISTNFNLSADRQDQFQPILTDSNRFQLISTNSNCPQDFSFPSGHASLSFAAASVLAAFDKKRKWFYYFTAILISYSRIYLGCHFFFDILAGGLIGFFISKIILIHISFKQSLPKKK